MENEPRDDVSKIFSTKLPPPPSAAQQSWGATISIVVIVLMIVIGAFYSWGKRIAQNPTYQTPDSTRSTSSEQTSSPQATTTDQNAL